MQDATMLNHLAEFGELGGSIAIDSLKQEPSLLKYFTVLASPQCKSAMNVGL
jgi:hypothetical protein